MHINHTEEVNHTRTTLIERVLERIELVQITLERPFATGLIWRVLARIKLVTI